ncbi:lactobin A/cerein 7B family class IIb bacteriocin [Bacteroides sp.]|uniref:lactobin A/cerein 7B family class IIb bacteriocin n=1 Tax=Bacteroides sp. TaxID=29523 RepID=UPI002FCC7F27
MACKSIGVYSVFDCLFLMILKKIEENALMQEMNLQEMQNVNGGIIWWLLGGLAYDILSNWDVSVASFNKGLSGR